MIAYDAGNVVRALATLRGIEAFIEEEKKKGTDAKIPVAKKFAAGVLRQAENLNETIKELNLRTTSLCISECVDALSRRKISWTYDQTSMHIMVIGVTLRRELNLMKTFCIEPKYDGYFEYDFKTALPGFEIAFPSAVFEVDEAGKCHALGRSTACVFHLMRAMEIAVRSVAKCLGIPDPTTGNDKNWGAMLSKIKAEITARQNPPRWSGNDKDIFSSIYVSLDAVRVAWRNTTMHIENKYTEDEAEHIFVAVRGLLKSMAMRMDETGQPLA